MRLAWKEWKSFWDKGEVDPYVHWRISREGFSVEGDPKEFEFRNKGLDTEIFKPFAPFFTNDAAGIGIEPSTESNASDLAVSGGMFDAIRILSKSYGDLEHAALVLPSSARNRKFDYSNWIPDLDSLPDPPPADAVILGVIDSGIALGHRRLQFTDGSTRVLAAWQQSASAQGGGPIMPFGRELYSQDIDELLKQNRPAGADGPFDEETFNRHAGLVEMRGMYGHRELERRAAHGTHVMDIAAGFDPKSTGNAILEQVPVIAVNLPSRKVVGLSGSFLEFFVILAVCRIATLSDALYEKARRRNDLDEDGNERGYRVLINLSFGMNAGPRDGTAPFHRFIQKLNESRTEKGLREIEIVMPAGNDNLKRGQAQAFLKDAGPKGETELLWRILPEDSSSNYLEIWSDELIQNSDGTVAGQLEIKVTPPGQPCLDYVAGVDGRAISLGDGVARVYCTEKVIGSNTSRVRYVICTGPTYANTQSSSIAPAGLWRIAVRNRSGAEKRVFFSIQTDQSARPDAATGLRSYFEDPIYERYDEEGRLIDSFGYKPGRKARFRDRGLHVRRHGTLNALAHFNAVAVIGGYRLSDGRPADYSGTGTGKRMFSRKSRGAPTCSLPSDDSPTHFGRLGAGARDGSAVNLSGTSFATALATRYIVDKHLNNSKGKGESAKRILFDDTKKEDTDVSPKGSGEVDIEKVGSGRLGPPDTGYLDRIGFRWRGRGQA